MSAILLKVTYSIELLGTIWLPPIQTIAQKKYDREYTFATWTPKPDWNDPVAELRAIEDKLLTDTGDFQSVDDWCCEKIVSKEWTEFGYLMLYTRSEIIRNWEKEDNREIYYDILYHQP